MRDKDQEQSLRAAIEEFVAELLKLLSKENVSSTSSEPKQIGVSKRTILELVSHEGIVQEAYRDSKGIWTWGIGVTSASGHKVLRYKDNPQPLSKVIEIFKWLVETKYLPAVKEAFEGVELTEAQLAAALSFHYNTGSIKKASWVRSYRAGNVGLARKQFMYWIKPEEIISRRQKECDLFFDNVWSNKGLVNVYTEVNKPSYTPNWGSLKKINIETEL